MSWKVARLVILLALAAFYFAGATAHARRVNTFKARGDQSGYLGDAEAVYANWHGKTPPVLVGERNRMPLYAGFLALFYRPTISDPEFFDIGKRQDSVFDNLVTINIENKIRSYLIEFVNDLKVINFGSSQARGLIAGAEV